MSAIPLVQIAETICEWMPRLVAYESAFYEAHAYSAPTPENDADFAMWVDQYSALLEDFERVIGDEATAKRARKFANTLAELGIQFPST